MHVIWQRLVNLLAVLVELLSAHLSVMLGIVEIKHPRETGWLRLALVVRGEEFLGGVGRNLLLLLLALSVHRRKRKLRLTLLRVLEVIHQT